MFTRASIRPRLSHHVLDNPRGTLGLADVGLQLSPADLSGRTADNFLIDIDEEHVCTALVEGARELKSDAAPGAHDDHRPAREVEGKPTRWHATHRDARRRSPEDGLSVNSPVGGSVDDARTNRRNRSVAEVAHRLRERFVEERHVALSDGDGVTALL